ncbi:MAG: glycine cleavage system H protein [Saprospiraceae bacterium]|jgi:glycine cleavage system H protein
MSNTKFTKDHEWATLDGGVVTVGITNFAQEQLGDIVYVEAPDVGGEVTQGDECAVVESVKAAGDIKSPVSGEVIEVNEVLEDAPETVNSSPEGEGWLYKVKPADEGEFDNLMDAAAYAEFVESVS